LLAGSGSVSPTWRRRPGHPGNSPMAGRWGYRPAVFRGVGRRGAWLEKSSGYSWWPRPPDCSPITHALPGCGTSHMPGRGGEIGRGKTPGKDFGGSKEFWAAHRNPGRRAPKTATSIRRGRRFFGYRTESSGRVIGGPAYSPPRRRLGMGQNSGQGRFSWPAKTAARSHNV